MLHLETVEKQTAIANVFEKGTTYEKISKHWKDITNTVKNAIKASIMELKTHLNVNLKCL